MRQEGDPLADAVVAELFEGGASVVHAVNYLMRDLVENDDLPSRACHSRYATNSPGRCCRAGPTRSACVAAPSCYMHTWSVVGHVMGVRAELLPADHAAGNAISPADRQVFLRRGP